jgi:hypothetical protein
VQDPHQPQHPPPQQPPPAGAADEVPDDGERVDELDDTPVTATVRRRRTVSVWPAGQGAGSSMVAIDRVISKVSPQERQRMS